MQISLLKISGLTAGADESPTGLQRVLFGAAAVVAVILGAAFYLVLKPPPWTLRVSITP